MIADKKGLSLNDMKHMTMDELMLWVAYYDLEKEMIKEFNNE